MIQNELELRHSIKAIAKQYVMVERIAEQTVGKVETREDEIDGVESMIRKIEREVAVYLAAKYGIAGERLPEQASEREHEFAPLQKAA